MARLREFVGGMVGMAGAVVSSLCCLLPLTIVVLGLGSGAFMATTMRYTAVFIPLGILSVSAGFYLHARERRRCANRGCRMAGSGWNLAALSLSALIVAAAVFFTLFPEWSSELLMWATATGSTRWRRVASMTRRTFVRLMPAVWLAFQSGPAAVAESAVVRLRIDGMTWGAWPVLVKRALEGLKGVRNAEVSFDRSEALVTYDKDVVTLEQMSQAVARYGFSASPKGRDVR